MIRNPLTIKVESYLGAFFVLSTAIFFGLMVYRSAQDFDSESIIMESQRVSIKTVSPTEKTLINNWVKANHITLPKGKGYRYVINEYKTKPWLD